MRLRRRERHRRLELEVENVLKRLDPVLRVELDGRQEGDHLGPREFHEAAHVEDCARRRKIGLQAQFRGVKSMDFTVL